MKTEGKTTQINQQLQTNGTDRYQKSVPMGPEDS